MKYFDNLGEPDDMENFQKLVPTELDSLISGPQKQLEDERHALYSEVAGSEMFKKGFNFSGLRMKIIDRADVAVGEVASDIHPVTHELRFDVLASRFAVQIEEEFGSRIQPSAKQDFATSLLTRKKAEQEKSEDQVYNNPFSSIDTLVAIAAQNVGKGAERVMLSTPEFSTLSMIDTVSLLESIDLRTGGRGEFSGMRESTENAIKEGYRPFSETLDKIAELNRKGRSEAVDKGMDFADFLFREVDERVGLSLSGFDPAKAAYEGAVKTIYYGEGQDSTFVDAADGLFERLGKVVESNSTAYETMIGVEKNLDQAVGFAFDEVEVVEKILESPISGVASIEESIEVAYTNAEEYLDGIEQALSLSVDSTDDLKLDAETIEEVLALSNGFATSSVNEIVKEGINFGEIAVGISSTVGLEQQMSSLVTELNKPFER